VKWLTYGDDDGRNWCEMRVVNERDCGRKLPFTSSHKRYPDHPAAHQHSDQNHKNTCLKNCILHRVYTHIYRHFYHIMG